MTTFTPPARTIALGLLAALLPLAAPLASAKPADLDTTFGDAGRVFADAGGFQSTIQALAIQKDGKIIAGGSRARNLENPKWEMLLLRYQRDGKPDTTFGEGGTLLLPFAGRSREISSVAIDARGRIVCTGVQFLQQTQFRVFISRFLSDGTPDKSFGSGGTVIHGEKDHFSFPGKVQLQDDGKIVVFGSSWDRNQGTPSHSRIIRLLDDGTPDSSFAKGGVLDGIPVFDQQATGTLLPDGRMIVSTLTNSLGKDYIMRVACYRPDGRPDPTYGKAGIAETPLDILHADAMAPLVAMPDGGIVFGGGIFRNPHNYRHQVMIGRLTRDGLPDASFGTPSEKPGIGISHRLRSSYSYRPAIAVDPRGRVIMSHNLRFDSWSPPRDAGAFGLITRFTPDGKPDATFGRHGARWSVFGNTDEYPEALAVQPDGKILVGGRSDHNGKNILTLARLQGGGLQPDVRLGLNRKAPHGDDIYSRRDSQTLGLTIQPDDAGRDVFITFQNDGTVTDSFLIAGTFSLYGFSVTYYLGDKEVILAKGSGQLETGPLAPGETYQIRARIKYDTDQAAFDTTLQTYTVTAISLTDRTARDRATIIARLK